MVRYGFILPIGDTFFRMARIEIASEFKTLAQDISSTTWLSHNKNSHFELLKSTKKQVKKKKTFSCHFELLKSTKKQGT